MNLDPNDLALYAHVVDSGSFTRAAERVNLPKSTLSRRLSALEKRLGERLLLRTTRRLTVTEFGAAVLDHARQVVAEVDSTLALAQHRQVQPSGLLRVSMTADFATGTLPDMLARFAQTHPAITLELDLSPRRVDLVAENFDLAIRIGDLAEAEASLAARRIAIFTQGLYASPAYLQKHGIPVNPEALLPLHGLMLPGHHDAPAWRLASATGDSWEGAPAWRTVANSPDMLVRMARAGAGVVAVADFFVEAHVKAGELARVLPDWHVPSVSAWAVYPGRRLMPARTRVFLSALSDALQPCMSPAVAVCPPAPAEPSAS